VPSLTPSRPGLCIEFDEGNECLENNGDHNYSDDEKIEYILNYNEEDQAKTFEYVPDILPECMVLSLLDTSQTTTSENNVTDNVFDIDQVPVPQNIDDILLAMVSTNSMDNTNIASDQNNFDNSLLRKTKKTATSIARMTNMGTKKAGKIDKKSIGNITTTDYIDEEARKKALAKARVDRCRAKKKETEKQALMRKEFLEKENQKLEEKIDNLTKEHDIMLNIFRAHGQAQPEALMTIMSVELGLI